MCLPEDVTDACALLVASPFCRYYDPEAGWRRLEYPYSRWSQGVSTAVLGVSNSLPVERLCLLIKLRSGATSVANSTGDTWCRAVEKKDENIPECVDMQVCVGPKRLTLHGRRGKGKEFA